jgi:molybdopterin converting factor small subunit
MVVVNFKLSALGRVETALQGVQTWRELLLHSSASDTLTPEGVIALRRNQILSPGDLVRDGDEIDVFPALSGG